MTDASRLCSTTIALPDLERAVAGPAFGAIALFVGTVRAQNEGRTVTGIEYTAYEPMAERELASIVCEAEGAYPGVTIAVRHRLGLLAVGETSVGIAVAHAHRRPALRALEQVIEGLKARVPIWKREHYVDGERAWVSASASVSAAAGQGMSSGVAEQGG